LLLSVLLEETGNGEQAEVAVTMACDGGSVLGCFALGYLEQERSNTEEAARLYEIACKGGIPVACFNLAVLELEKGNREEAARFYRLACDGGDPASCNNLAIFEQEDSNNAEAARLYELACDGGSDLGCQNLENLEQPEKASSGKAVEDTEYALSKDEGTILRIGVIGALATFVLLLLVTLVRVLSTTFDTSEIFALASPFAEVIAEDLPTVPAEDKLLANMRVFSRPCAFNVLSETIARAGGLTRHGVTRVLRAREFAGSFGSGWTWLTVIVSAGLVFLIALTATGVGPGEALVGATYTWFGALLAYASMQLLGGVFIHWSRLLLALLEGVGWLLLMGGALATGVLLAAGVLIRWLELEMAFVWFAGASLLSAVIVGVVGYRIWGVFFSGLAWSAAWLMRLTPRPTGTPLLTPCTVPAPCARTEKGRDHLRRKHWPGNGLPMETWTAAIIGRIIPTSARSDHSGAAAVRTALCRHFDLESDVLEDAIGTAMKSATSDVQANVLVRRMAISEAVWWDRTHRRWNARYGSSLPDTYGGLPDKMLGCLAVAAHELDVWDSVLETYLLAAELFHIGEDEARAIADDAVSSRMAASESALAEDYQILGCSMDASDAEIRRQYRILMAKYHPDKLGLDALPEDMAELAKVRFNEIRFAYERIVAHRKANT